MAQALAISDPARMRLILETFSWFDDIRWADAGNYNPLNYAHGDLSADEKLLTHWLCYIADRQTAFQRVWDVGGYVVSDLVRTFSREKHRDVRTIFQQYLGRSEKRLWLQCDRRSDNERLWRYGVTGPTVQFASRYAPEDLVLTYHTLRVLDATSSRSFARYMVEAVGAETDHRRAIRRLAEELNALTYAAGGAVSAKQFDAAVDAADKDVRSFTVGDRTDSSLFGRKRLWCSLRDYLKSPDFNTEFVTALRCAGTPAPERWARDHTDLRGGLDALELPGDVWNNAAVFRRGLFSPYLRNEPKRWDMPRTVREIHGLLAAEGPLGFYPEQLDVTFDFVPRMCDRQACDVCPFGAGTGQVCHARAGRLCSVALVSCGYRHGCEPETCGLRRDMVKGLCTSALVSARPDTR